MAAHTVITCYALGAAALAFWWLVHFPGVGPHRTFGSFAALVAAWAGMAIALSLFNPVAGSSRYGVVAAMMLLVLPAMTAAFWAAACLLRALAALLR